jgi:hypothetical protein
MTRPHQPDQATFRSVLREDIDTGSEKIMLHSMTLARNDDAKQNLSRYSAVTASAAV